MRIISYAWTTPALVCGRKTVTRREWDPAYARLFKAGEQVYGYDRSPRVAGKPVAVLRLTAKPSREADAAAPDDDYDAEGFRFLLENRVPDRFTRTAPPRVALSWREYLRWRSAGGHSWVVRFEVVDLTPHGLAVLQEVRALNGIAGRSRLPEGAHG